MERLPEQPAAPRRRPRIGLQCKLLAATAVLLCGMAAFFGVAVTRLLEGEFEKLGRPAGESVVGLLTEELVRMIPGADPRPAARTLPPDDARIRTAAARVRFHVVVLAATTGLIVVVLTWLVILALLHPLQALARNVRKLVDPVGADAPEFGGAGAETLVESFHCMAAELVEARRWITAQRGMEAKIRERSRHLRTAARELEQLDDMKEGILSSVSHEFRTPLSSIRAFAEILLSDDPQVPATNKEFLGIILQESDRLGTLVDGVLDLAKLEAGEAEFQFESLRPRAPVEAALQDVRPEVKEKGLSLDWRCEPGLPQATWDRDQVRRLVREILANAVRFSPQSEWIEVRLGRHEEYLVLTVRDYGPGIPEQHLEEVFEKFHQVGDTLTEKPPGAGLGLRIARLIAHRHGGTVRAEVPGDGPGARLRMVLPVQALVSRPAVTTTRT